VPEDPAVVLAVEEEVSILAVEEEVSSDLVVGMEEEIESVVDRGQNVEEISGEEIVNVVNQEVDKVEEERVEESREECTVENAKMSDACAGDHEVELAVPTSRDARVKLVLDTKEDPTLRQLRELADRQERGYSWSEGQEVKNRELKGDKTPTDFP